MRDELRRGNLGPDGDAHVVAAALDYAPPGGAEDRRGIGRVAAAALADGGNIAAERLLGSVAQWGTSPLRDVVAAAVGADGGKLRDSLVGPAGAAAGVGAAAVAAAVAAHVRHGEAHGHRPDRDGVHAALARLTDAAAQHERWRAVRCVADADDNAALWRAACAVDGDLPDACDRAAHVVAEIGVGADTALLRDVAARVPSAETRRAADVAADADAAAEGAGAVDAATIRAWAEGPAVRLATDVPGPAARLLARTDVTADAAWELARRWPRATAAWVNGDLVRRDRTLARLVAAHAGDRLGGDLAHVAAAFDDDDLDGLTSDALRGLLAAGVDPRRVALHAEPGMLAGAVLSAWHQHHGNVRLRSAAVAAARHALAAAGATPGAAAALHSWRGSFGELAATAAAIDAGATPES